MTRRDKEQTVKNFINAAFDGGLTRHAAYASVAVLCGMFGMAPKTVDAWTEAVNTKWDA